MMPGFPEYPKWITLFSTGEKAMANTVSGQRLWKGNVGLLALCGSWLVGCAELEAGSFLAYQLQNDGSYRIDAREIASLKSPKHMTGELGQIWSGGHLGVGSLEGEDLVLKYRPGQQVDVLYTVADDVARPLDRSGIVLYSFYGHLQDVRSMLSGVGVEPAELFPVDVAVAPVAPDIGMTIMPSENAAYVSTAHTFVLLDDLVEKEVPLAANAGIVAHEFGHALFQWLTLGELYGGQMAGSDAELRAVASLNEGFADMVGALVTGQPYFIAASLDMPERRVDGDWSVGDVEFFPDDEEAGVALGLLYDPYALGTVFASVVWDVVLVAGDAELVLQRVIEATRVWGQQWASGETRSAYRWLDAYLGEMGAEYEEVICESVARRFGDVYVVTECS
ncbi:MAG: hypothetical protein VX519_03915 [Myxococcota bacterium]|nr:hypothetical protein [Myxococcota bacterium]